MPFQPTLKKALLALALLAVALLVLVGLTAYYPDLPAEEVDRRYTDANSHFLEIAGSRVHFKDVGAIDRPALLLIHGTASSLHTWDGWAEQLGDRFRLLRLDLPGYGLTGANAAGAKGAGDYSIRYRLEVIDALMDARDVRHLAVAGNSLGGLLAWRYAAHAPERVRAAILVDPAGAPRDEKSTDDEAGFRVIDLARMPIVNQLLTGLTPRFLIRDALHQVYGDPSKVKPELVDRHHDLLRRAGSRRAMVEAAAQRALTAPSPVPLGEITQPVLVMWGGRDTWIPVSDAHRFHDALPNSELVIYDDAGHVPMEEIPEASAADALDFLERHYLPTLDETALGEPALGKTVPEATATGASRRETGS